MCPNGNADLTRSSILRAAVEIISRNGLAALTAGRLIEQAGISKGGLYHHFRTMAEVESEVLALLTQDLLLKISAYPNPKSQDEFFEMLEKQVFECFAVTNEPAKALFGFLSASSHDKAVQFVVRRFMDDISLKRMEQLKSVSPGVSRLELHSVVQVVSIVQMGLMTRFFLAEDPVSLRNYWGACRTTLLSMLEHEGVSELVESQRASTCSLAELV